MSSTNPIRRSKAVLKMPRRMGDKLIKAQSILASLTNNTYFPLPWPNEVPSLMQLQADIKTFSDAETLVKTGFFGATAARDASLFTLMNDLRGMLGMVQIAADQNPVNAADIIESAGFTVKQINLRGKMLHAAYNTQIRGTVMLTAGDSRGHEWQMSKDKTTSISLPSTNTARTFVNGLEPGDVWYFRNRKINNRKNAVNWSAWIELTIGAGGKTISASSVKSKAGSIKNT